MKTWRDLIRTGWERLSAPGDECAGLWRHEAGGWELRHCGHPTANWPWSVTDPAGAMHVASNGCGFRTVVEAGAYANEAMRAAAPATVQQHSTSAWIPVAEAVLDAAGNLQLYRQVRP